MSNVRSHSSVTVCRRSSAILALLITATVPALNAQTSRDIAGWKNLRFGMTIGQVMAAQTGAELIKNFCGENRGFFVPSQESCEQVWIRDVSVAGLKWDATLKFSQDKELFQVELSLADRTRANNDTFASILASLNKSYVATGKDAIVATPSDWAVQCKNVRDRRTAGEAMRPIDFLIDRQHRLAAIARPSGYVTLKFYESAWCDGAPQKLTKHLAGPYLELTYQRRTIATTDGL